MKLYLVTADTYDCVYGAEIECFGIATNKKDRDKLTSRFHEEYGYDAKVTEIKSDKFVNEYLGGYIE